MNIAVLLSGGVDSSVALSLLCAQGHHVTAFYLKIWLEDELSYLADCPWAEDLAYVTAVCKQLQVPLEVINLQQEYHQYVVRYTIDQIKMGNTPNPDILCNSMIKFGFFVDMIGDRFDAIASGHYAQILPDDAGGVQLVVAPDAVKDQTYFLSQLTQLQLRRVMFPIGHLHKTEVRVLARQYGLPTQDRKDSQGICFLGKFKFRDFVRAHVGQRVGPFIEIETGTTVGTHQGFWFYTIGQRQGIGLSGGPWYVVSKDSERNIVFISRSYAQTEAGARSTFQIGPCNWVSGNPPADGTVQVKLRHGPQRIECKVVRRADNTLQLTLAVPDQGIAAGQFAVLYDGAVCLGGGAIRS